MPEGYAVTLSEIGMKNGKVMTFKPSLTAKGQNPESNHKSCG